MRAVEHFTGHMICGNQSVGQARVAAQSCLDPCTHIRMHLTNRCTLVYVDGSKEELELLDDGVAVYADSNEKTAWSVVGCWSLPFTAFPCVLLPFLYFCQTVRY